MMVAIAMLVLVTANIAAKEVAVAMVVKVMMVAMAMLAMTAVGTCGLTSFLEGFLFFLPSSGALLQSK